MNPVSSLARRFTPREVLADDGIGAKRAWDLLQAREVQISRATGFPVFLRYAIMPSQNQFVSQRNGAPLPNVSLNTAARSGERTQDEQLLVRSDSDAAHLNSDPWRVLRIQGEFVAGFDALANVGPSVTLF